MERALLSVPGPSLPHLSVPSEFLGLVHDASKILLYYVMVL
jgi:hypothetical protein